MSVKILFIIHHIICCKLLNHLIDPDGPACSLSLLYFTALLGHNTIIIHYLCEVNMQSRRISV